MIFTSLYSLQSSATIAYYGHSGYGMYAGGFNNLTLIGIALLIIVGIIGAVIQSRLQATMRKYSEVYAPMTGAQTAQTMLRQNGINHVRITHTRGQLTDHYNPSDQTVNLSDVVYAQPSIAAMAVAAHECGHALQHAQAYPWLGLRSKLVPLVNIGSRMGQLLLMLGLFMLAAGSDATVAWVGLAMFGTTTLFTLITLPVEFDASRRALQWLENSGTVNKELHSHAATALRWAAMTYVAAALSSLAMLLYYAFIILSRSRNSR